MTSEASYRTIVLWSKSATAGDVVVAAVAAAAFAVAAAPPLWAVPLVAVIAGAWSYRHARRPVEYLAGQLGFCSRTGMRGREQRWAWDDVVEFRVGTEQGSQPGSGRVLLLHLRNPERRIRIHEPDLPPERDAYARFVDRVAGFIVGDLPSASEPAAAAERDPIDDSDDGQSDTSRLPQLRRTLTHPVTTPTDTGRRDRRPTLARVLALVGMLVLVGGVMSARRTERRFAAAQRTVTQLEEDLGARRAALAAAAASDTSDLARDLRVAEQSLAATRLYELDAYRRAHQGRWSGGGVLFRTVVPGVLLLVAGVVRQRATREPEVT